MGLLRRLTPFWAVYLIAVLLVLLNGQNAGGQQKTAEVSQPAGTSCSETQFESNDWNTLWRKQANDYLDCIVRLVDKNLGSSGARANEMVSIRRDELERIRTYAGIAKDAAARIGR